MSSPDAPIPSDETAQALKYTVESHAGLPGWDWVGREDKMSLTSQAPTGRKASPLMGLQRDLQISVGSRAGSALGKALQAGGESAGKIRIECVLGGRLCRDKLWGQKCDQIFHCCSSPSSGYFFFQSCPWGFCCHQSTSKSLGSVVISNTVLLDNSQQTLF